MTLTDLAATTDEDLVARAQKGDQDCLATLYDRYYDRVYRFTLARLGNTADAEDLAQEVFLRMVDKLSTFRWQGMPFAAWLFRISRNVIIDFVRRRARRGQQMLVDELDLVAEADPEARVERSLSKEELIKAMRRLTPTQQEVLTLRFGGELSVRETAKALGKSEGTIKATQFQALQALRRILAVEARP